MVIGMAMESCPTVSGLVRVRGLLIQEGHSAVRQGEPGSSERWQCAGDVLMVVQIDSETVLSWKNYGIETMYAYAMRVEDWRREAIYRRSSLRVHLV